ncbi:rhizoxin biosynthesis, polyketide synthase RhiE [Streptomyces zhaozhouensis]|uniref:Rhizoxin biosynthesis, polyketide synthase RhiE n=1 Tax=Streptomyces zhaozhouensis TaxID=1300267 RepID=A0A286E050_9ACTN|nr:SDR family NAD(P)-dependent oxidoreductase [Streptomyces zhaozhouensis]SOD64275.1 rhizoxin biosynthesis, polyketide synthase RhiE [Streptomyces zhaozhouensis]
MTDASGGVRRPDHQPDPAPDRASGRLPGRTLADLYDRYPDEGRFHFRTGPGEDEVASLTGAALRRRARRLSTALQAACEPGQRVLVQLPNALTYVTALAACAYANVVAVPMLADLADDPEDTLAKLRALAPASGATCLVTGAETAELVAARAEESLGRLTVVVPAEPAAGEEDAEDADDAGETAPDRAARGEDPAVLLFTSGSLTAPKGVTYTHSVLLAQIELSRDIWEVGPDSTVVSWLPLSHNFGISVGLLLPLAVGVDSVLMPPSTFVRQPDAWPRAISAHGATHTGAPNFALDFLCDQLDPAALAAEGVSLASLTNLLCAGELIREDSHRRFTETFAPLGLRPESFCPNYGMTEIGAVVTEPSATEAVFRRVDVAELERGRAVDSDDAGTGRAVAAIGPLPGGDIVRVVDPETGADRAPGEVGEIWVRYPGVFRGYHENEEATEEAFSGPAGLGHFRTGDLGFVLDGRLHVTGREKELIIVRGENHYPADIEATVRAALPGVTGRLAVFGCDIDDAERVVVVQEVDAALPGEEYRALLRRVVAAVSEKHQLTCHEVVLSDTGGVAHSAIGKILRKKTMHAYLAGALPVLASYRAGAVTLGAERGEPAPDAGATGATGATGVAEVAGVAEVRRRLVAEVFGLTLGREPAEFDGVGTFAELGLDSLQYIRLARQVERVFGVAYGPALLFKHRTVDALAAHLAAAPAPVAARPSAPATPEPEAADAGAVAVVGVSLRLPGGATDLDSYWRNLVEEKDCVTPLADSRPEILDTYRRHYGPDTDGLPRDGAFIDDVADFDAAFFGIAPLEAESMDPQQRKALEVTWRVFEDAGYRASDFDGEEVGVFVGVHNNDYAELVTLDPGLIDVYGAHLDSGLHASLVANRVSRWFNFRGPSEILNTACSSSLVAVHRAARSLRDGTSRVAVAAGVNLMLSPRPYRVSQQAGMLSPGGRCRTFDAAADGFVRGEGYAAVLLKPLARALADGDHIHGVIRASAVNHDGKSNSLRAPNLTAQKELVKTAYLSSGTDPATVGYIEAHGTGTALGDPIEVQALREAFAELDPDLPTGYCGLGSAKANMGHLESAAGLAGLLKALLSVRHGILPGLPHFETLNPHISLADSPFHIVDRTREWPAPVDEDGTRRPRRAGVSSFGFGGVNAHVVVEEHRPEPRDDRPSAEGPAVVLLSARTDEALRERVDALRDHLRRHDPDPRDLAHTLAVGREEMPRRVAFLAADNAELTERLDAWLRGEESAEGVVTPRPERSAAAPATPARLAEWIDRGEHPRVAQAWADGLDLEGRPPHAGGRRVPLPTYPFARRRHWLTRAPSAPAAPAPAAPPAPLVFEEVWRARPLPAPTAAPRLGTVVFLVADPAHRELCARALRARDPRATAVFLSPATAGGHDEETVGVDPADPESFARAFARVTERHGRPDALVYLWAFEDPALLRDHRPLLHLAQGLFDAALPVPRLLLSAQPLTALDRCHVESWLGLERSLRLMLPGTHATVACPTDLPAEPADVAGRLEAWLPTLVDELAAPDQDSALYRDGVRRTATLREVAPPAAARPAVRAGGTYLITGGLGGLGLLLARHLARSAPVNLVLTGRSPLDPERRARLEKELHAGRFHHLRADVADEDAMRAGLDAARERFGPFTGVIHAAGVDSRDTLLDMDADAFGAMLRPKVEGTLVLDRLLADDPLDFTCYFSSVSAVIGDFGSGAYAAGNRFQTSFAQHRPGETRRGVALSVNWPLWADGGMNLAGDDSTRLYLKSSGQRALETEEGLALFDRLLAEGAAQRLVMAGDPERIRRLLRVEGADGPRRAPAPPAGGEPPAAPAPAAGEDLADALRRDLRAEAGALLRMAPEEVPLDTNMADFGFDSISLTDYAAALTRRFGLRITPAVFFDCPTLDALARHCLDEQAATVRDHYAAAAPADRPVAPAPAAPASAPAPRGVPEPIAIIGMSGRFPDARTVDELWDVLADGRDVTVPVPEERFPGHGGAWRAGLVPGVDEFDPLFFEIAPSDARAMDPRQRLLLQESWHALEDAGYGAEKIESHTIGTFLGAENGDYARLLDEPGNVTANHEGILAARLAYFLNFSGPVMAINTACSSGLAAIHEACGSLRNGECDTALAGGVNLMTTAQSFVEPEQAGMLSPDGRCHAFDKRANGLVPGEAVAVVVLKRLSLAEADGDRVLGVITGSGLNYDGRTNGITAPSSRSQARLLSDVYRRHAIDPAAIDCVFTHGTGTRLGDPIEINALTRAFQDGGERSADCALVTTKPNVGHAFAASGVVSLIGLVQAMRHATLPASIHCEELSDYVDWEAGPFTVNTVRREWPSTAGRPRTGAVSAFGISGTNAHLVVEEYPRPTGDPAATADGPRLLAFSARSPEALDRLAERLAARLRERPGTDLAAVSATLLTGRLHHRHRRAVVAADAREAADALAGAEGAPRLFHGQVPREFQPQEMLFAHAEELVARAGAEAPAGGPERVLSALAELYCQGYDLPWSGLFGGRALPPVSLPGYPFARERYWAAPASRPTSHPGAPAPAVPGGQGPHPLLRRNTSDLTEHRFASVFHAADEALLGPLGPLPAALPPAAQLGMARAAADLAAGAATRLRDVTWGAPAPVVDGRTPVSVALHPAAEADGERIAFEVYQPVPAAEFGREILSQGVAEPAGTARPPRVDLERLRREQDADLLLAPLPADAGPGTPPALVGAALRVAAELTAAGPEGAATLTPAGVRETVAYRTAPDSRAAWAVARRVAEDRVDLELVDAEGEVCLVLRGLTWRSAPPAPEGAVEPLVTRPVFVDAPAATAAPAAERLVVLCGLPEATTRAVREALPTARHTVLPTVPEGADTAAAYETAALALLDTLQGVLRNVPAEGALVQVCVPADGAGHWARGLFGMLATVRRENPAVRAQLVECDPATATEAVAALRAAAARPDEPRLRQVEGALLVSRWENVTAAPDAPSPWRDGGVYLLTGGYGIAAALGAEIARRAERATLVLTGRSPASEARLGALRELVGPGTVVDYRRTDVTDAEQVDALVAGVLRDFGALHGVIHTAGVLRDGFAVRKTPQAVREVLAPKVTGLVRLDEATADLPLDLFLLCSSVAGALGNVGQADYAAANGFLDVHAARRAEWVRAGRRSGRTLSVNWPLWRDAGMRVDAATEQAMRAETGMVPLRTATAIDALYRALASGHAQVMVMEGDPARMAAHAAGRGVPAGRAPAAAEAADPAQTARAVRRRLTELFAETTDIAVARVDAEEPLDSYGIDSFLIARLNHLLSTPFPALPKTLFFEHRTLAAVADALAGTFPAESGAWAGDAAAPPAPPAHAAPPVPVPALTPLRAGRRGAAGRAPVADEPIAVIGMSGRFPGANNVDEFWANLRGGKSTVTEIPADRWRLDGFYTEDVEHAVTHGKSYSKWGGFLDGFADFDPYFFRISPREALEMDPQERLFLQETWRAFEDAAYPRDRIARQHGGRVGVFVGITRTGFELLGAELGRDGAPRHLSTNFSSVANRVSYVFDLHGPSLPVDTMCSSSLSAIHQACEHLRRGSSEMAVAGGVNVYTHPSAYVEFSRKRMLSPDGLCRSFGKGANGMVPGEGVASLLLKPLSRAMADGDHVYAVIRGTGINHDGKTNGYTVPNPVAQRDLVRGALDQAGVDARTVSFLEAHGTGTELGDPIEIAGLTQAFREDTDDVGFCAVGSVKSNIGHLEAASGVAGVIKVIQQLNHGELAPSLHARELNPHLDIENSPFYVQRELGEWRTPHDAPRTAGVSSFGAGGANAHVVIQEFDRP